MITPLFSIALMGRGTAEVESLPSYIHRCAIAHSCDVGQLMQTTDRLIDDSNLCFTDSGKPRYIKPHELVRSGKLSDLFIRSFSQATGEELGSSVIWVIRSILGVSAEEVVKGFRWCPECFAENERLGIPAYFKLIWHMSSVKACHIHRTPLIGACETCGCDQSHYRKKHDIGSCQECGASLSIRQTKITDSDLVASWEDLGNDVVGLFHDLAHVIPGSLSEDGPYKSLNDLLDYYWKANREDVFYAALTRDEMIALTCRDKNISMLTARRIAFRLGVPLYAFIAGEAAQMSGVLDHGMFCQLPGGYLDVKHKEPKDHMAILRRVHEIIDASDEPLTVKEVCQRASISTGYMAHRYPVLYKTIVEKRKAYDEECRLKTLYRAQSAALDYFISDKYDASTKSRNHAFKVLRAETGFPKWVLEKVIDTAYLALG